MKRLLLLVACLLGVGGCAAGATAGTGRTATLARNARSRFAEMVSATTTYPSLATAPVRYVSNPIIPTGRSGSWNEAQVYDPVVMVDPADSSKLIMFVSGMKGTGGAAEQAIGRYTANVSDPYTWTAYRRNPILTRSTGGRWDDQAGGVRLGSVVYDSGTFYLYYAAEPANYQIGLATSRDGIRFTRYAGNPILTKTGQGRDDSAVSSSGVTNPAVIKIGSTWTMIYSCATAEGTLRVATSSDGRSWTKSGAGNGDVFALPGRPIVEWHQIYPLDTNDFLLIVESGPPFCIYVGRSTSVDGVYSTTPTPKTAWLTGSGRVGDWDRYHVATASLFQLPNGNDLLFYAGAGDHDSPYTTNKWSLGVATVATAQR